MTTALRPRTGDEVLRQLSALGAHMECRGEKIVLRVGARPIPAELIQAARGAKAELSKMLNPPKMLNNCAGEHLRGAEAGKSGISAALVEGAHMTAFDEHLRTEPSKMLTEDAHVSAFEKLEDFGGSQPLSQSKALNSPSLSSFDPNEHLRREWSEAEEERAAIVEHDGGIPHLGRGLR